MDVRPPSRSASRRINARTLRMIFCPRIPSRSGCASCASVSSCCAGGRSAFVPAARRCCTSRPPSFALANVVSCCTVPPRRGEGSCPLAIRRRNWGSRRYRRHPKLGMTAIIPSPGSCQVLCVSIDVATVLRIMTPHDREGPAAWSSARHEREILCTEDEKEQK